MYAPAQPMRERPASARDRSLTSPGAESKRGTLRTPTIWARLENVSSHRTLPPPQGDRRRSHTLVPARSAVLSEARSAESEGQDDKAQDDKGPTPRLWRRWMHISNASRPM